MDIFILNHLMKRKEGFDIEVPSAWSDTVLLVFVIVVGLILLLMSIAGLKIASAYSTFQGHSTPVRILWALLAFFLPVLFVSIYGIWLDPVAYETCRGTMTKDPPSPALAFFTVWFIKSTFSGTKIGGGKSSHNKSKSGKGSSGR
jgi:multidrug transporter EmrE-like cation transporter